MKRRIIARVLVGFALPTLRLDSRLRGNDRRECRETSLPGFCGRAAVALHEMPLRESLRDVQRGNAPLPGVWGCPPIPLPSPKCGGLGVERVFLLRGEAALS